MEISSPLVQLALLETLKANNFSDEIDLFLPFIAVTLSNLAVPEFTPEILQKELGSNFGFSPPISAVQVLIARAKRRKLVYRKNHTYILNTTEIDKWKNGYQNKKDDVISSLEILRRDFIEFAFEKFDKVLSGDECDTLITEFIEKNILSVTNDKQFEKNELREKIKNTDHVTASFISHIHRQKNASLEHFSRFVKGMLLANYLCHADKIGQRKSYKTIKAYIDTPIVIGLLGFNGPLKQKSLVENMSLLTSFGINICVFDKTIEEIERLLCAWRDDLKRRNYQRFNTKTLELLRHLGYDSERLDTEIKLLKSVVEKLGIIIEYGFKIDPKYQCDEVELEKAISPNFKESKNLEHDTICISRIYNMRKGKLIKNINQPLSVFVTPNKGLIDYANQFFKDEISEKYIPLVVSEHWMTAMFWFKNPDLFESLPMEQVVSSAYGLLYKDDRFWNGFIEKLETLEKRGKITEEDFIQVRWDADLLNMVHDVSVDVGENFTEDNIFEIVETIKQKNIAEKDIEIKEIKKQKDSEVCNLKENLREKDDFIRRLEGRNKKLSDKLGLAIATLLSFIIVAAIFWTTFISLSSFIAPEILTESYKKYRLTSAAGVITLFIGVLGYMFGWNLLHIFDWIKTKVAAKILFLLQG